MYICICNTKKKAKYRKAAFRVESILQRCFVSEQFFNTSCFPTKEEPRQNGKGSRYSCRRMWNKNPDTPPATVFS